MTWLAENPLGIALVGFILKDIPENSHLKIRALFSLSVFEGRVDDTWIWPEFYTYLKLAPHADVKELESQLDGFVNKYLGEVMDEFGIEDRELMKALWYVVFRIRSECLSCRLACRC